jgi:hypothetical protein
VLRGLSCGLIRLSMCLIHPGCEPLPVPSWSGLLVKKIINLYTDFLRIASHGEGLGANLVRMAIAIVFLWIGALKFVPYEADSITPLVAQSPVMEFFYAHPKEYAQHMTQEGQLVPERRR